jgi:eukaryotic-like serine/threonine-protein kinase
MGSEDEAESRGASSTEDAAVDLALEPTLAPSPALANTQIDLGDTRPIADLAPGLDSPEIRRARDLARHKLFGSPDEPTRIDRFVIIERLGGGGMGVVYVAYDPQLDRKIALKLLRPGWDPASAEDMQKRLLREAQAMARVVHPNVITVHDVGVHDGQVYVAMEFVDGQTLSAWLEAAQRSWADVRSIFVAIGRALAAAHAAGLVHRDFKPDNVMIGSDERVVVLDFGLAKAVADEVRDRSPEPHQRALSLDDTAQPSLGLSTTGTGALVGTPAYMAPEQHRGRVVDAKADQFSYCVALFEAVYGRRPFAGTTYAALADAVCSGKIDLPAERGQMPARAHRAMLRGLEVEPESRWPDMSALLVEIAHDPAIARRRWMAGGATVVAIAVALASGQLLERVDSPCRRASDRLERTWTEGTRQRAEQAFVATDKPYAMEAWRSVEHMLSRYEASWRAAHDQICGSRSSDDEEEQRSRLACLDARTLELETLTALFVDADGEIVERSTEAADALTPPEACTQADATAVLVLLPKEEALRGEVLRARAQLAHVKGLGNAGKHEQALALARDVLAAEPTQQFGPLRAEAALRVGWLLRETVALDAAGESLREAVYAGLGDGHDEAALHAAIELVWLTGWQRARFDEALPWMRLAESLLRRRGSADDAQRLDLAAGAMFLAAGRHQEAQHRFRRPIERHQAGEALLHGRIEPILWLGRSLAAGGSLDEGHAMLSQALVLAETAGDMPHPERARVHTRLGDLEWKRGRYVQARHHFEQALAIESELRGEAHPAVASALTGLARTAWAMHAPEEASAHVERLLALTKTERVELEALVAVLEVQSHLLSEAGRHDAAERAIGRGLALARRHGNEHPLLAFLFYAQAELRRRQNRTEHALHDLDTTEKLMGAELGAADPRRREVAIARARTLLDAGEIAEPTVLLQDAVRALTACCEGHFRLPDAELALARALDQSAAQRSEVNRLLDSAARRFEAAGRHEDAAAARAIASEEEPDQHQGR